MIQFSITKYTIWSWLKYGHDSWLTTYSLTMYINFCWLKNKILRKFCDLTFSTAITQTAFFVQNLSENCSLLFSTPWFFFYILTAAARTHYYCSQWGAMYSVECVSPVIGWCHSGRLVHLKCHCKVPNDRRRAAISLSCDSNRMATYRVVARGFSNMGGIGTLRNTSNFDQKIQTHKKNLGAYKRRTDG